MNSIQKDHSRKVLAKLNKQLEAVLSSNNTISLLEIDLIKEDLRALYELVDSIDDIPMQNITTSSNAVDEIDKEINDLLDVAKLEFENDDSEIDDQIKEQESALDEQNDDDKHLPEIPKEEEITTIHDDIDNKLTNESRSEEKDAENIIDVDNNKAEVSETIAVDKPIENKGKDTKKTVHILDVEPEDEEFENNESKPEELLPSTINLKPIKSLKTGIGINDKFMIINDLFEGSSKYFNSSIIKLDSLEDGVQALYMLGDMKDENLWETKDEVFQTFKKYIERRYVK
ncbi:MAG: hypothetical protein KAG84_07830 [Bacteroidales bacterium]|nr:hypothetical protein [Bacteroidales bacterium]